MSVKDGMLDPRWTEWMTENLLRGADPALVARSLESRGLSPSDADSRVALVLASPVFAGARRLLLRSAGVEQAARLRRSFEAQACTEVSALSEEAFDSGPWSGHRPVMYRGAATAWPASDWTFNNLAERFGDVAVKALDGRSTAPRWWARRDAITVSLRFGELLERVQQEAGDNLYAVGRCDLLQQPKLSVLSHDFGHLPGLDTSRPHDRLWVGPSGTLTPLHHDQSSAWLVQLVGRKRVWAASPLESSLLNTADGVFNLADPRKPVGEQREVGWLEWVLEPGDAVFLPVGWWHQVLALDPSISVSRGGFRSSSTRAWYAPGRLNRPATEAS